SLQNFVDLGNTVKEFLYLIRCQDISNEDFCDKIVPYQMLFPKTLLEKFMQYYLIPDRKQTLNLLPPRKSKIESTIINRKLISLFINWINRTYNSPKVKYEFKLLYHSSRDGLNVTTFHQKCNNVNKTLVVGKIENSDQLVGGYNPLNWNGSNENKFTD